MTAGPEILSPEQAAERLIADIARPARLLVAISGGSDSCGLLIALSKFNPAGSGLSLFAATVDHALRPESADEARAVAALCAKLGIPHFIRRWEGEKPRTGVSAAAREARYRLLIDVADEIDATAIVTGHTLDDQAETIAMRAARGEGEENSGLAGMAQAVLLDRRRWLLRPFLATRRSDIRAFLTKEGLGWIDDPSNVDPHYERVRIRGRLAQESPFDAAAQAAAATRRTALSDEAARLLRKHVTIAQGVLAHIDPVGLQGDAAVRRHALSLLAAVLGGRAHALGSDSMDRVMAFLDGGLPGRITAGRVIFDRRREGLYLVRENRGILPLHIPPGNTAIWDGRYRITNAGPDDIIVSPTAPDRDEALALFPGVPPAIAMRAVAAMPFIEANALLSTEDRQNKGMAERSTVRPLLAPFDRFLPQFELRFGVELAVLLGCDVFPRLPVKDSSRKR